MIFAVIETDWKDSWNNFKGHIKWAINRSLLFQKEISGDVFGIDSKYLLMTGEIIEDEVAEKLIQLSCFDLNSFDSKQCYNEEQWKEISEGFLLESYESKEEDIYNSVVLKSKEGEEYIFVYPKDYTGLHK